MDGERVLFLDGEALVIDKPAGLAVDPPRDGSLSLDNHLESLRFGFRRWPQAVHRLDRDTSGCLLLSRNPKAHGRSSAPSRRGWSASATSRFSTECPRARRARSTCRSARRAASTRAGGSSPTRRASPRAPAWRLLDRRGGRSLVEFRPATGRTHQIRVHAASGLGAAVVGDPVYGRAEPAGMMLHAAALSLPRDGKPPVEAEAPWPARFAEAGFAGPAS